MTTAVVGDLHLGSSYSIVRQPDVRRPLVDRLRRADRVVLLGDLLSLRDAPAAAVLDAAGPFLDELGRGDGAPQIVAVPGNHDHRLAGELLEALDGPLGLEHVAAPGTPEAGRLLRDTGIAVAYPGLWIRPDVYATHGHYLDVHLSFPRPEVLLARALARVLPPTEGEPTPGSYEVSLAPLYAFAHARAQRPVAPAEANGGSRPASAIAREAWGQLPGGRRRIRPAAVRAGFGAAVGILNLAGLGPLRSDLSRDELERAGVAAMTQTAVQLGLDSSHVIFGHTHRAGPVAGERWRMPGGGTLTNPGSWVFTKELVGDRGAGSPFWPGRCVIVEDTGPPRLRKLLGDTAE